MLGEHGDHFVPILDRVRVAGEPVALDAAQREGAERFVRHWYERHVALDSGRSSTWTTGRGLARLIAPPSISGLALTVPVTLARGGARELHEWELTEDQRARMAAAALAVREAVDTL